MASEISQFEDKQRRLDGLDKENDGNLFDLKSVSSAFFSQADQVQQKLEDPMLEDEDFLKQSRDDLAALFEKAYQIGKSGLTEDESGISEDAKKQLETIASKMENEIYPEIEKAFIAYQKIQKVEEFVDKVDAELEQHQKRVMEGEDVVDELETLELSSIISSSLLREASGAENLFSQEEKNYNDDLAYRLQSQLENINQIQASVPYVQVAQAVFLAIENEDFKAVEAAYGFLETKESILPDAEGLRKVAVEESRVYLDQWEGEKNNPLIYRQKYLDLYTKNTTFEGRYGLLLEQFNLEKKNGEEKGADICRDKLKSLVYDEKSLSEVQRGELLVEMELLGGNSEKAQELLDSLRARDDLTESDAENLSQKQLSLFITRLQKELPENREEFSTKFESLKSRQTTLNSEFIFLNKGEIVTDHLKSHRMDKDNMLRNMREADIRKELDAITINIIGTLDQNILYLNDFLVKTEDSIDQIGALLKNASEPQLGQLKEFERALKQEKLRMVLELSEINARRRLEAGDLSQTDYSDFKKSITDITNFTFSPNFKDVHGRSGYEQHGNGSYDLTDIQAAFLKQSFTPDKEGFNNFFDNGVWQMYRTDMDYNVLAGLSDKSNSKAIFGILRQMERAINAPDCGDVVLAKTLIGDIRGQIDKFPDEVRERVLNMRYSSYKNKRIFEIVADMEGEGLLNLSDEFYLNTLPQIAETGAIISVAVAAAVATGGSLAPFLSSLGAEGIMLNLAINLGIGLSSTAAASMASHVSGNKDAWAGGIEGYLQQSLYSGMLSFGIGAAARGVAPSLQFAAKSGLASKSAEKFSRAVLSLAKGADYLTGGALKRTFFTNLVRESAEEYTEEYAQRVHPLWGFAMSLLNGLDGGPQINLQSGTVDAAPEHWGLKVESRDATHIKLTYDAAFFNEVVRDLGKNVKVQPDGTIYFAQNGVLVEYKADGEIVDLSSTLEVFPDIIDQTAKKGGEIISRIKGSFSKLGPQLSGIMEKAIGESRALDSVSQKAVEFWVKLGESLGAFHESRSQYRDAMRASAQLNSDSNSGGELYSGLKANTPDYSDSAQYEVALGDLRAQRKAGKIDAKTYVQEQIKLRNQKYEDLMGNVIKESERYVMENPDVDADALFQYLSEFAAKKFPLSETQVKIVREGCVKYVEERDIIKKYSEGWNDQKKREFLDLIGLKELNLDDIEVSFKYPATVGLYFKNDADYKKFATHGIPSNTDEEERLINSDGIMIPWHPLLPEDLNGRVFCVKTSAKNDESITIHEVQHRLYHSFFNQDLYSAHLGKSKEIRSILLNNDLSIEEMLDKINDGKLMDFPQNADRNELINRVFDLHRFELFKGRLRDELIAYSKDSDKKSFKSFEIPLIYQKYEKMHFADPANKIALRRIVDTAISELNRLLGMGFSSQDLYMKIQTAPDMETLIEQLRRIAPKPSTFQDEVYLKSLIDDFTEEELENYGNIGYEGNLDMYTGLSVTTAQRIAAAEYIIATRQSKQTFMENIRSADLKGFYPEFMYSFNGFDVRGGLIDWKQQNKMLDHALEFENVLEQIKKYEPGLSEVLLNATKNRTTDLNPIHLLAVANIHYDIQEKLQELKVLDVQVADNLRVHPRNEKNMFHIENLEKLFVDIKLRVEVLQELKAIEMSEMAPELAKRLREVKERGGFANFQEYADYFDQEVYKFKFEKIRSRLGEIEKISPEAHSKILKQLDDLKILGWLDGNDSEGFKFVRSAEVGVRGILEKYGVSKEVFPDFRVIVDERESSLESDPMADFMKTFKEQFFAKFSFEYETEAEFDQSITEPLNKKLEALQTLLNSFSDLPKVYRAKIEQFVEGQVEAIKRRLNDSVAGKTLNRRLIEVALMLPKSNYDGLREIHQKTSELLQSIASLPSTMQEYFQKEIAGAEQKDIDEFNPQKVLQNPVLDRVQTKIDFWSTEIDVALFALEKVGYLLDKSEGYFQSMSLYKKNINYILPLIENVLNNRDLISKYPEFGDFTRIYELIENFNAIYNSLQTSANPKNLGLLSKANSLAEQLRNMIYGRDRVFFEAIRGFDKEIHPDLKVSQRDEITRLFNKLVLKGNLSFESFKSRIESYNNAFLNLSRLDALNTEGREQFAINISETLDNFLVEHIIQNGEDAASLEAKITESYELVSKTFSVTINLNYKALEGVLESGRFKRYEDLDVKHRETVGYGDRRSLIDAGFKYADKFIVGALASENGYDEVIGPAPFYGHGVIKLKPEIINQRVSFFEGDSMTSFDNAADVHPTWLLRKWENLESRKLDTQGAILSKALMDLDLKIRGFTHRHTAYVEAHIIGEVTLTDIHSIQYALLSKDADLKKLSKKSVSDKAPFEIDRIAEEQKTKQTKLKQLESLATSLGIPFEVQVLNKEIKPVERRFRDGLVENFLTNDKGY